MINITLIPSQNAHREADLFEIALSKPDRPNLFQNAIALPHPKTRSRFLLPHSDRTSSSPKTRTQN